MGGSGSLETTKTTHASSAKKKKKIPLGAQSSLATSRRRLQQTTGSAARLPPCQSINFTSAAVLLFSLDDWRVCNRKGGEEKLAGMSPRE